MHGRARTRRRDVPQHPCPLDLQPLVIFMRADSADGGAIRCAVRLPSDLDGHTEDTVERVPIQEPMPEEQHSANARDTR